MKCPANTTSMSARESIFKAILAALRFHDDDRRRISFPVAGGTQVRVGAIRGLDDRAGMRLIEQTVDERTPERSGLLLLLAFSLEQLEQHRPEWSAARSETVHEIRLPIWPGYLQNPEAASEDSHVETMRPESRLRARRFSRRSRCRRAGRSAGEEAK